MSSPSPSLPPVPTDIGTTLDWATLFPLLLPIVLAVIASNALAQVIISLFQGRTRKKGRRHDDASTALKALRKYRFAVQTYALAAKPKPSDPKRDSELATLASDLVIACAQMTFAEVKATTLPYIAVAERFAAQDPFLNAEEEETAFLTLLEGIAKARKKEV